MIRILDRFIAFIFQDPVRPLEILFVVALLGWAQFLTREPRLLGMAPHSALKALPAPIWAAIMAAVAVLQVGGITLRQDRVLTIRFAAMAVAGGLWTLIAIGCWTSPVISFGAPVYTAFAVLAGASGIWLGWNRQAQR